MIFSNHFIHRIQRKVKEWRPGYIVHSQAWCVYRFTIFSSRIMRLTGVAQGKDSTLYIIPADKRDVSNACLFWCECYHYWKRSSPSFFLLIHKATVSVPCSVSSYSSSILSYQIKPNGFKFLNVHLMVLSNLRKLINVFSILWLFVNHACIQIKLVSLDLIRFLEVELLLIYSC